MVTPSESHQTAPRVSPMGHPLDDFYAQMGRPLPAIEVIQGEDTPEPYKTLLVHHNDMTPTLAAYYKAALHLEVLGRQERGDVYYREVVLHVEGTEQAVEFGAIKINLGLFAPVARRLILEEQLPLGRLLEEQKIQHSSRPKGFLKLKSDDFIGRALRLKKPAVLYGRRNTLYDPVDRPLAEIVEILPP